jgi:CheY-like chemotaxis protein
MKILVAEDSSTFRLILGGLFQKLNHEVVFAETGRQAWHRYEQEYFPVVVTDWHMPELDGMSLTRLIRARPHDRYTYIILVTGHGGEENYQEGIRAGVDDFLEKAANMNLLSARLLVAQRIVGVQNHLRQLEEFLSVCSYCKNVRQGEEWVAMEQFVRQRTGAQSSHGICPRCWADRVQPELAKAGITVSKTAPW